MTMIRENGTKAKNQRRKGVKMGADQGQQKVVKDDTFW